VRSLVLSVLSLLSALSTPAADPGVSARTVGRVTETRDPPGEDPPHLINGDNTMPDTEPSLFTMLRDALGDRVDPNAANFLDLMSEDFVMEFPYARPGMQPRIEGRAAVAAYLSTVGDGIVVDTLNDVVIHETTDPEVVILEFTGQGRALKTGEPYENRYISVIRTRHGRVVHWKDYWNPIAGLKARLGAAAVDEFLRSEPPDTEQQGGAAS
jgi:uncharacterized protein